MNRANYTKELAKLRIESKAFAQRYPSLAPLLVEDSTNPDVERLLEGFAYLTADIHEKLEDEFPELINGLTNIFFPSYLRPIPSAVMLEFISKENVGQAIAVQKHVHVASQPVGDVKCIFRTVAAFDIEPVRLTKIEYIPAEQGLYALKLDITCLGLTISRWHAKSLNFYLADEHAKAMDMFYILLRYCSKVGLRAPDAEEFYLPSSALRAKQFSENTAFDFDTQTDVPSRYIFRQYLTFYQQFLQVELTNIDQWLARGSAKNFSIVFYFKLLPEWFSTAHIPKLVLNAIPAINLFPENGKSFSFDQTQYEYKVSIDAANADDMVIYAIKKIEGFTSAKDLQTYQPFSQALNNLAQSNSYETHYHIAPNSDEVDWYISLNSAKLIADNEVELLNTIKLNKTLRIDLLCCNGAIASKVIPGMLNQSTNSTPATATFNNLHTPTTYYPIEIKEISSWRFLSLLSYNFFAEADLRLFKEILMLETDFLKGYNKQQLEMRLKGISEFSITRAERLYCGRVIVGFDILMASELNAFDSHGDLFLFFSIIDLFFANQIQFNTYVQLTVKISDTGDILTWPARTVDKILQ